ARCALRDLAAAERAVLDVADLSRGHLRLALTQTSTAYLLGPLAAELHSRHPGITLDVKEMTQAGIEASLLADEIDLGIAFHCPHLPGITAAALCTETLSLVIGASQTGAGRKEPLHVRELAGRHLALLSGGFATRVHVDAYFTAHNVQPLIAVEANSVPVLIEIVRRTPLATVLPDAITDDNPDLAHVPLEPPLPTRTITLLRRENAYQSAAARAFVHLTQQFVHASGLTPPEAIS
ncbi:MAG: LysR family transcriptional regulator, cyn operon transcriptional activator, partial [Kribbellaceae bacterium]|nr:LysR family transcriptional regulator, cyn operon transcriptional activator [Kribbellaceae bacterium]